MESRSRDRTNHGVAPPKNEYGLHVRSLIAEIIEELMTRQQTTDRVDLNDIAEVIGTRAVSYDDVERIIVELESRGCLVGGDPSVKELELMQTVVVAARRLSDELGRRPTVDELAARLAVPTFVVRRALENATSMGTGAT